MALPNCERMIKQDNGFTPVALMCDPYGLLNGGGGGVATDQVGTSNYRAIATGTGYSPGDLIQRFTQLDATTLVPTGNVIWFNVDTQLVIAAPLSVDIVSERAIRIPEQAVSITVDNTAGGVSIFGFMTGLTNYVEIQIHDAPIIFTYDAGHTPPTVSPPVGVLQETGALIKLQSRLEALNFRAIRATGVDATLHVQYLQVYGQSSF